MGTAVSDGPVRGLLLFMLVCFVCGVFYRYRFCQSLVVVMNNKRKSNLTCVRRRTPALSGRPLRQWSERERDLLNIGSLFEIRLRMDTCASLFYEIGTSTLLFAHFLANEEKWIRFQKCERKRRKINMLQTMSPCNWTVSNKRKTMLNVYFRVLRLEARRMTDFLLSW